MRRHLRIVCSSEKEKESVSKKRSVQSMLSRSNDTERTKRDAIPNRRRREFSRIECIDLHVLSPQKGNEERKRGSGKREKMRHINHINHLSGLHHHQKKKKKKTRTRDNKKKKTTRMRQREKKTLFNPTSDGSSQRRTHGRLFLLCVSWCE